MRPMPASADFRLYSSNSLEVLAALLAESLREPPPGGDLLDPDTVLIPQPSMRRWLQKTLAERYGIAANLRFLAPGEFVAEVLAANLEQHEDATTLDPARLQWRLFAALRDPSVLAEPAFAGALRAYLSGDASALNAWSLAGGVADAFAKYQAWRRDWLLRWDRGAEPGDWQAVLWRHATRGRRHRAQAIDAFLQRYGRRASEPPRGLPGRIFAFACLNVSPDVLQVMAAAARATTLHFYLPTPTRKYWGDLRGAALDALEPFDVGDNPLLAAWGRAGRDFVATLFSYEIVAPREIEAYAVPDVRRGLLQCLKADLLERRAPAAAGLTLPSMVGDRSLQVHSCHTRLREVQVLHDQLRGLLEDDADLQPRDIAVMAPDIDAYAPHIAAVFGGAHGTPRYIPYTVADGSAAASSPLADLFLQWLDLPHSRITSNEVLDLLALPGVQRRFAIDDDDVAALRGWIIAAGARWGFDADDRARLGAPREEAYTWRFALDRLLLGHASGSDETIDGVAPWPHLEGRSLAALDALIRLLGSLEAAVVELAHAHPPERWQQLLAGLLADLLPAPFADVSEQRSLDRLLAEIDRFGVDAASVGHTEPVAPEIVRAHFRERLADSDPQQPFFSGGASFCRMVPMRLIPFRVIALLGLDDGAYPRREPPSAMNRLVAALDQPGQRRRGDRSVRDDDRFLFLQLLTAADAVFYLSYIGRDAVDGSVREPSVLVSELLDVAARYYEDPRAARERLVLRHALQPFGRSPDADARRFAFDPAWQTARGSRPALRSQPAFAPHRLELAPLRAEVGYAALRGFLLHPQRAFLRGRLELRLPEDDARVAEDEPFVPADALEYSLLRRRVLDALLDDDDIDEAALARRLEAEAMLAPAAAGSRQLQALLRDLRPLAMAVNATRRGSLLPLPFSIDLGHVTLHGALDDVDDANALRFKPGKPSGRDWLRWHLDALVLDALGETRGVVATALDLAPLALPRHDPKDARSALRWLLALMRIGESTPLRFAPRSSWSWADSLASHPGDTARARDAAETVWVGRDGNGERNDPWIALALRGADPFADDASIDGFGAFAEAVVGIVRDARLSEDAARIVEDAMAPQ